MAVCVEIVDLLPVCKSIVVDSFALGVLSLGDLVASLLAFLLNELGSMIHTGHWVVLALSLCPGFILFIWGVFF